MPNAPRPNPVAVYRSRLQDLPAWDDYLRQESRLPGPRANLELLEAVIDIGDRPIFDHLLALDAAFPNGAAPDTPDEFLTICGVAGLGKLLIQGESNRLAELRRYAADTRWRIREAVAIALQYYGDHAMPMLVEAMEAWSTGSWLEQRAAVAALAEPRLLREPAAGERSGHHPVSAVLPVFDRITQATVSVSPAASRSPEYHALRQSLGYGWSVVVAAEPEQALLAFERWLTEAEQTRQKDLLWIVRQNLQKNRLKVMDSGWVATWAARLGR